MKLASTPNRHSRDSGNPFLSHHTKTSMDSRFRGNDEDVRLLHSR